MSQVWVSNIDIILRRCGTQIEEDGGWGLEKFNNFSLFLWPILNSAVLNTPRLARINFRVFNRNYINTLLEFINCEYLF